MLVRHYLFEYASERGFLKEKQFAGDHIMSSKEKHLRVIIPLNSDFRREIKQELKFPWTKLSLRRFLREQPLWQLLGLSQSDRNYVKIGRGFIWFVQFHFLTVLFLFFLSLSYNYQMYSLCLSSFLLFLASFLLCCFSKRIGSCNTF